MERFLSRPGRFCRFLSAEAGGVAGQKESLCTGPVGGPEDRSDVVQAPDIVQETDNGGARRTVPISSRGTRRVVISWWVSFRMTVMGVSCPIYGREGSVQKDLPIGHFWVYLILYVTHRREQTQACHRNRRPCGIGEKYHRPAGRAAAGVSACRHGRDVPGRHAEGAPRGNCARRIGARVRCPDGDDACRAGRAGRGVAWCCSTGRM